MSFDVKNKELASLFECPVCFDYASPPILQCQSGHIVCSNCRSKLGLCPTCRGPLENIRNLALEKLAMNVMFPCKYSSNGCTDLFPFPKKKQHEEICDYRPYMCPCPESTCRWMGKLEYVMPHLQQYHKNITSLEGEDIVFLATDITLPGAVDWVMMQSCFGHHFMLVLEKQERFNENRFYAIVRLIGTKKQAKQFAYRLELYNGRRRLTWDATPCSIHDSVQLSIANSDCLILDSSTAHVFAKNGNLGISVTIWHMGNTRRNEVNSNNTSSVNNEELGVQTSSGNQSTVVYPGYGNNKVSRHNNNKTLPIPPPPLSNSAGSPDCITSQTNLVVVSSNNNLPSNGSSKTSDGKKREQADVNCMFDNALENNQMDLSSRSPQQMSPVNMSEGHTVNEMGISSSTSELESRGENSVPILPAGRPFCLEIGQGDTSQSARTESKDNDDI